MRAAAARKTLAAHHGGAGAVRSCEDSGMFDWLHALIGHRRVLVHALVVSGFVLALTGCGASSHVSSSASAPADAGSAAAGGGASPSSGSGQPDSPRRARPQAI